jgi:Rhodopirellula transposase DDE domain
MEAADLGWGGVSQVAEATGIARTTLYRGMAELRRLKQSRVKQRRTRQKIRQPGAGRKRLAVQDSAILTDLERLVAPVTRGDPRSPLRWTCKSTLKLADELVHMGHQVGARTVAALLTDELKYSLQAPRKTREGKQHPDRNAQFEYLNQRVREFQKRNQPVISVDAKKKELVGDFKNGGQEWHPQGEPETVRTHDFKDKELGKVVPYGVYDMFRNEGWVSVGIDHDTAAFALASIRAWWKQMGSSVYPKASELLITADAGGSNGYRRRTWKLELQRFADETGLRLTVCHFPPGTSKWNKIEHRMFCHITQNWRGRSLTSHRVIVNLIANTTTTKGLTIRAKLDTHSYPKGIDVSDEVYASLNIKPAAFHGEWNYTVVPRSSNLSKL